MSETNPQAIQQLDKLADICCRQLEGGSAAPGIESSVVEELLKSLLMSGYARQQECDLRSDIEGRVKDQCREPSMHRGGALSSITDQLQKKFEDLKRWDSRQPDESSDPKSANISSATDA